MSQHGMTETLELEARGQLSQLPLAPPPLLDFSTHILLWVELESCTVGVMTGRLLQKGNKVT